MLEIKPLDQSNIDSFLELLRKRGSFYADFYRYLYSSSFYGGFIAYYNEVPAGCIGYVKRLSTSGNKEVAWFNDWFVDRNFAGKKIGEELIRTVALHYGKACGIITPQKSGKICESAGYIKHEDIYECRFPVKPFKISWSKYYSNGHFGDSFVKRYVRSLIYSGSGTYSLKKEKANFEILNLNTGDFENLISRDTFLKADSDYLYFVINGLQKFHFAKRDFWATKIKDSILFGYNEILSNNIKQSVLLYASAIEEENLYEKYSALITLLKNRFKIDQINILLPYNQIQKFKLSKYFFRIRPFFTYNLDYQQGTVFYHIDKESTWCIQE